MIKNTQIERELRDKPPESAACYETELVVYPKFGLIAEPGVSRDNAPNAE
jgi:hypothetical protein